MCDGPDPWGGITLHHWKSRSRHSEIIWYNPSFNLGREFLELPELYFHRTHPLRKISNCHMIKLSYSCLPNFDKQIQAHNNRVESNQNQTAPRACNCQNPQLCLLNGLCFTNSVVYRAVVAITTLNLKLNLRTRISTTFTAPQTWEGTVAPPQQPCSPAKKFKHKLQHFMENSK